MDCDKCINKMSEYLQKNFCSLLFFDLKLSCNIKEEKKYENISCKLYSRIGYEMKISQNYQNKTARENFKEF